MEKGQAASSIYPSLAAEIERQPLSIVNSSDEDHDPEAIWMSGIDPDRSVRSDVGYASRRRRTHRNNHGLPKRALAQKEAGGPDSECSSGTELSPIEDVLKTDSSSSLRISSEEESRQVRRETSNAPFNLSSASNGHDSQPEFPTSSTFTTAQLNHYPDDAFRAGSHEYFGRDGSPASLLLEEIRGRISDSELYTDLPNSIDETSPLYPSSGLDLDDDSRHRKVSSSPDLYENFFSRTPLSLAGKERAMIHRPTNIGPQEKDGGDIAGTNSMVPNTAYEEGAGHPSPLNHKGIGSNSLPLALNLSTKRQHGILHRQAALPQYPSYRHQEVLQNRDQTSSRPQFVHKQNKQSDLRSQLQEQQSEDSDQQPGVYKDQGQTQNNHNPTQQDPALPAPCPGISRESSSADSPRLTPYLGDGHGTAYNLNGGGVAPKRLLHKIDAGEDTSQFSSVSSCYSLADNIHKHASNKQGNNNNIDFGYLKSAMKQSSQNEGQGHRRLSLFSSVMRRVSIHRRESTPASRIATFLFGADDTKEKGKKGDCDTESKETAGDSLLEAQRAKRAANLRESLFQILSGLYGIMVVILGAVIPITEIFISEDIHSTFEGFYIYLYTVSILFLIYVYAYLLRRNRLKTELITRTLSRSLSWSKAWARGLARADTETRSKFRKRMISLDVSNHHTGTFYLRLGVLGFGIGSMIHSGLNFGSFVSPSGGDCSEPVQWVKPLIHLMFTFFQLYFIFMNSKMCIHRYKKLARFGLVHMCSTNICVWFRAIVVETLHVINHSESKGHGKEYHGTSSSHHGTSSSYHGTSSSYHGTDSNYHAASANATHHHGGHKYGGYSDDAYTTLHNQETKIGAIVNVSDVLHLGRKLKEAVEYTSSHADPGLAHSTNNLSTPNEDDCHWTNMMSKAVESAAPYLYPCTIEYSLMCAGILYIMWTNVGKRPRRPTRTELETDSEGGGDEEDEQRTQRMSVDCTSSSRGLFLGILLMVGTIISIIAFYMLVNQEEMGNSAIILTHMSGTFIYTVTLLALLLAAGRMKNLSFRNQQEANLEDILVLISYTGLLVFIIFSLIASILAETSTMSTLTILSNISMLVQATVQTIFMLAGDRMSAATEQQVRKKPGREFITFLLISNFAMWAINTFQTQTPQHNPIQVNFYGPEAWAIFTHISVPLGIYYRFHSTVCFSNIWKNAWKKRKHD